MKNCSPKYSLHIATVKFRLRNQKVGISSISHFAVKLFKRAGAGFSQRNVIYCNLRCLNKPGMTGFTV